MLSASGVVASIALQLDESDRHNTIDDFCSGNTKCLLTISGLDDIDIDADVVINYVPQPHPHPTLLLNPSLSCYT